MTVSDVLDAIPVVAVFLLSMRVTETAAWLIVRNRWPS